VFPSSFCYLQNLERRPLESEKCDEHEDEKNATGQLKVFLGFVLAQTRNTGKKGSAVDAGLGQDQKKSANQGQVPEEELHVPQDAVSHGLKRTVRYFFGTVKCKV
jgi:hypothetical protein